MTICTYRQMEKAAMAVSDAGRNAEEVGRLCKIDRCNGLLDYRFEAVRPVKSNFNQVLYYRLTAFAISI